MAKRRRQEDPPSGSPAWMSTFSDLMNLLLCFFVLLFSMSSIDASKYEQVVASLSNSFSIWSGGGSAIDEGLLISSGVSQLNELAEYYSNMGAASEKEKTDDGDPMEKYKEQLSNEQKQEAEELYEEMVEISEEKKVDDYVNINMDDNYQYVRISLNGAILFASGQAEIKNDAKAILNKVGDILKIYDKHLIKIEGHTDNVPFSGGKYSDNMVLSAQRAISVCEYLVNNKNLDPTTLEASGRSEYEPIASNKTEEGRSKNRRVEIKIYTKNHE